MPILKVNVGTKASPIWTKVDAFNSKMLGGFTHSDIKDEMYKIVLDYVGDLTDFKTINKDTIVGVTNELFDKIVANQSAIAESDNRINEINNSVGLLVDLTTEDKTSIVSAINELNKSSKSGKEKTGDLSKLSTEDNTTLVSAINEVDAHTNSIDSLIGDLNSLLTTGKDNLINAINEVKQSADSAFQSANEGKTKIAEALIGQGVSATSTDTYEELANKIKSFKNQLAAILIYDSQAELTTIQFIDLANHNTLLSSDTQNIEIVNGVSSLVVDDISVTENKVSINYLYSAADYHIIFPDGFVTYNSLAVPSFTMDIPNGENTRVVKFLL